ncbi:TonB-dependent receptor [bacterium SCSIO 12643]|nr:TonB-dependent receptor [bacterium SCSIO 12643]
MKKAVTIFAFLLFCTSGFSQSVTIFGTVTDTLGKAMEQASVMAFNQTDSTVAAFGFTNRNGRFALKVDNTKSYFIRCSYLGFETYESAIQLQNDSTLLSITLHESPQSLKGFEVVEEFPVTISGDTIIYNTDAFTNGQERKLGDVLNKLPGFEVNKNGSVTVQGKKVDKILVDGKEFFDGDSKMAVQNIPADVIDKIDLLTNYSEIEQMKGLGSDENLALNIELKDGKKNLWFGDIEVGGGAPNKYLIHPNIFHYTPKSNINFIGDVNNIGEQPFTMEDYFKFSGGFSGLSDNGSSVQLNSDALGLASLQNNMAQNSISNLGALNLNYHPNKKWKFSVFGILNGLNNTIQTNNLRTYIRSSSEQNEINESVINQKLKSTLLRGKVDYKPNPTLQMRYNVFLKDGNITDNDDRSYTFGTVPNTINEINTRKPFTIDQKFDLYKNFGTRNIISAKTNWVFKKQKSDYFLQSDSKPFDGILPLTHQMNHNIFQEKEIITNELKGNLDYYYIINPRNHLNISLNIHKLNQSFTSDIQELDNGDFISINEAFENNATYEFKDQTIALHYRSKIGKLSVRPGVNLHIYQTNINQHKNEVNQNQTLFLPDLYMKYAFRKTKSISFNYGMKTEFSDISNLSTGIIIRNYNSLFRGNSLLQNLWYQDFSLNYSNFNMFNHINTYVIFNYQKRYRDINESVAYQDINRISIPTNGLLANERLILIGSLEKKFPKWNYRLKADLNYFEFQNTVEQIENQNTNFIQSYQALVKSNFIKSPNFSIGAKSIWANYWSSESHQLFITTEPFINMEIVLPKGLILLAEYTYTDYRGSNNKTNSQYDFLDATLYYRKPGSPWEFKLTSKNILNTQYIRRDQFSDNIISTYQYYVQPRYVLLSAKYDL